MAGNGVYFHPEVRDAIGRPPPHLRLTIRPHGTQPYRLAGDRESEIGQWYSCGNSARRAVLNFCRRHLFTAAVKIYTPDNALWREEWISTDGKARTTWPTAPPPVED